jgi:hypothetical protein
MCSFIVACIIIAIIVALGRPIKAANPCKTCKWFSDPKCGFYKTGYNVLGGKLVIHEYAEHARKNEHMCGEEGYMHESVNETDKDEPVPIVPLQMAILWPLNVPFAVLSGLVHFLDDDLAVMLRGF